MLVVDRADQLLEHVLQRDESRHAAVFVEDHRDLSALSAEFFQQFEGVLGLRHEIGGPHQLARIDRGQGLDLGHAGEEVLDVEDAHDVVVIGAEDRDAAQSGLAEGCRGGLGGDRRGQGHDHRPGRHDLGDVGAGQFHGMLEQRTGGLGQFRLVILGDFLLAGDLDFHARGAMGRLQSSGGPFDEPLDLTESERQRESQARIRPDAGQVVSMMDSAKTLPITPART